MRWRDAEGAAAVVDERSGLLLETNGAARARGIFPGQTGPQAQARDGGVRLLHPSAGQEECLTQLLADRALTLSPHGEHTAPGVVTADLRRTAKAVWWRQLGDGLVTWFCAERLTVRVGVAPTADLALLAARGADPVAVVREPAAFVSTLPIEALDPSESLRRVLADWGITTLGELLQLPRAETLHRLGAEAQDIFRRVSARNNRPLHLLRLRPEYAEAFDFDYEVETLDPLVALLERFLQGLTARLRETGHVACRMEFALPLDDGTRHERTFLIPVPTADGETLLRILRTHLEMFRLPQRPIGVRLNLEAAVPGQDQLCLFERALRDPNHFGETLARLKALVGNDAVGVPVPADTHEPDCFAMREFFESSRTPPGDIQTKTPALRGLPLCRYRPPLAGRVVFRDAVPAVLYFPCAMGEVAHCAGPFRLSGGWWDTARWEREEWDVELAGGGMFRIARSGPTWTMEGCYEPSAAEER